MPEELTEVREAYRLEHGHREDERDEGGRWAKLAGERGPPADDLHVPPTCKLG